LSALANRSVLVPAILALIACGGRKAEPEGKPEEAVERFFAAVAGRDCAAIRATTTGRLHDQLVDGCDTLFEGTEAPRLLELGAAEPDGRAPGARLVRVSFASGGGKVNKVVLRIEARDGTWAVATF
jgi:hypothetical protein